MNAAFRLINKPKAKFWVVPTKSMRDLIIRNRERLLPGCNLVIGWRDVNGYGIEVSIADNVRPGTTHFNL